MYVLVVWMQERQEKKIKTKQEIVAKNEAKREGIVIQISHGAKFLCNSLRSY